MRFESTLSHDNLDSISQAKHQLEDRLEGRLVSLVHPLGAQSNNVASRLFFLKVSFGHPSWPLPCFLLSLPLSPHPLSPIFASLQNRRPEREELEAKGILKDQKVAPALQQAKSELERSQLENKLAKDIANRPAPDSLPKNILEDK